ncbi:MAG: hypothetical protein O2954_16190, partial [bacterium]|nr:hypothetical protein [bacterium]
WTSRTNYICQDVALGTSSAGYDYPDFRDLPLVVDFPEGGRGYLVANPVGDLFNYAHASPLLWAAVQREGEALGLVVYDFQEDYNNLETHFILPPSDEIWIGDRRVEPSREAMVWLKPGEALVCRKGTAAVGIRFVWARTVKNRPAPVLFCVDGGTTPGSARVSVHHQVLWCVEDRDAPWATPGAACFVRVGSKLEDDAAFRVWRESFNQASVQVEEETISTWVGHKEMVGKLNLQTGNPDAGVEMGVFWAGNQLDLSRLEPRPQLSLLEVNGRKVGRVLLKDLDLVRRYEAALDRTTPVQVEEDRPVYWQASDGRVWAPMEVRPHVFASDGDFIWLPAPAYNPAGNGRNVDSVGSDVGSATWRLNVQKAGTYYLWGHAADNTFLMGPWGVRKGAIAFLVRIFQDPASPLYLSEWTPGEVMRWAWSPVVLSEMVGPAHHQSGLIPTALDLPAGEIKLQVWALEAEIGMDRWFLTTDAEVRPMERLEPAKSAQGENG